MKNLKKKGFTIVELVIVIAVIAVLAAVLIPTFVNLTKKANQTADIQAVRQMNTQLAINEVTGGKTINDVFAVLREAGLTAKDYTPLSSDTYFFWDEKENRILYTDKNYNVIYPEEYKGATKDNGWYSLSGTIDESSATIELDKNNIKDSYAVNSAADMSKLVNFANEYKDNFSAVSSLTINLNSNIDLIGADLSFGELLKGKNVTINGNGKELKGLYVSENHTQEGSNSEGEADKYGSALFTSVKNLVVKDITIKDCVTGMIDVKQGAIFAGQVTGTATFENVTVENCVVSGENKSGILVGYVSGGQKITLTNVKLKNNTVIAGEGECGVLFGVALNDDLSNQFAITNLVMENNTIKFADTTNTFKVNAENLPDYLADKALPKDGLFAYKTGVTNAGRIGLAEICFVAKTNFNTSNNRNEWDFNDVKKINMAAAIHKTEDLNNSTLITK